MPSAFVQQSPCPLIKHQWLRPLRLRTSTLLGLEIVQIIEVPENEDRVTLYQAQDGGRWGEAGASTHLHGNGHGYKCLGMAANN